MQKTLVHHEDTGKVTCQRYIYMVPFEAPLFHCNKDILMLGIPLGVFFKSLASLCYNSKTYGTMERSNTETSLVTHCICVQKQMALQQYICRK
jgi:hypothetical protein